MSEQNVRDNRRREVQGEVVNNQPLDLSNSHLPKVPTPPLYSNKPGDGGIIKPEAGYDKRCAPDAIYRSHDCSEFTPKPVQNQTPEVQSSPVRSAGHKAGLIQSSDRPQPTQVPEKNCPQRPAGYFEVDGVGHKLHFDCNGKLIWEEKVDPNTRQPLPQKGSALDQGVPLNSGDKIIPAYTVVNLSSDRNTIFVSYLATVNGRQWQDTATLSADGKVMTVRGQHGGVDTLFVQNSGKTVACALSSDGTPDSNTVVRVPTAGAIGLMNESDIRAAAIQRGIELPQVKVSLHAVDNGPAPSPFA